MSGAGTNAATGERAELPVAQLGDAVRSGAFVPDADTELPMLVGNEVRLVKAADIASARDQGWELASAEQVQAFRDAQRYESTGAQARAAGEAAVRGLTLGLSDAALVQLGVDPEGLKKRKELNPIIAGAGEITGAVAPLLLTGGGSGAAGLAAQGVRTLGAIPRGVAALGRGVEAGVQAGLGTGILARGASLGAAGAVEGGVYGLGQAVSEAALNDTPLTGERIAAHMGTGALLGGVAGGTLGTVAASVEQRVIPKLKEMLSSPKLERMVEAAGLKQWAQGRGKAMFTRLRRDFGDDAPTIIGRTVREEGLDEVIAKGATWDEMHAITQAKKRASGGRIGEALRQIDEALPGEAGPAALNAASRVRTEVLDKLAESGIRSDKRLAKELQDDFPGLFPAASTADDAAGAVTAPLASFEELHKLRARIDDIAFPKGLGDPTPKQQAMQKMRAIIEEEITGAADAAAEKMATAGYASNYSAEKLRYRALGHLDKMAESNAASEMANRTISLSDYVSGSAFTAGSLASLMAGDMSVLGSLAVSAFMGTGAAVVNKFLREQGQGIASEIGHKVLRLARTAQKQEREVTQAVGKFFAKASDATRTTVVSAGTDSTPLFTRFTDARSKLEQYEQQPEQKLSRALGDTGLTAPVVANEVRATATRAAAFLRSKLPPDRISPYDAQPLLKRDGARVSDSQMAKYLRYQRAVENPRAVIADLSEGKVSREGIEALKAVYPKLYADMSEKLLTKLSEQTERLPRAQLIQLSIALGQPLHPSLSPAFIAACQSVHAASRQAQQQGGPSGTPLNSTQPAKHMATESQRLEAGG